MPVHTVSSADGVTISYTQDGAGPVALVFVHGWLGSGAWWEAQRQALVDHHVVVQVDLAGHGASGRRQVPSARGYIADVQAVVRAVPTSRVVLVGRSMSGAYGLEAAAELASVAAIVLVDTLKNVEQVVPPAQIEGMLALYRSDYHTAIEQVAPQWLFGPRTPAAVRERLTREFLAVDGETAAALLAPLYQLDLRAGADRATVPVRAIHSDLHPSDPVANRRHFRDFAERILPGLGHYPMLEAPAEFTAALVATLDELALG